GTRSAPGPPQGGARRATRRCTCRCRRQARAAACGRRRAGPRQGPRGRAMTRPPAGRKPARRLQRSRLSAAEVQEIFARLAGIDPSPTTELEYTTPFELLVAVVLSAQATDVGVNKATRRLYPVANTPQAILDLGEDGLKRHSSTIGLF